jgi:D-alanine transaminase
MNNDEESVYSSMINEVNEDIGGIQIKRKFSSSLFADNYSEEEYNNGLQIMTHDDIRWHRCDIKTVNLVASSMVNQKAKDNGFDDEIYIRNCFITEATYANVFIVDSSNNLITHPSANEILSGITRSRIISLAIANKINVIEKKFTLEEMLASNEAFLTGSIALIRVINSINNIKINNNREISTLLRKLYDEFINQ